MTDAQICKYWPPHCAVALKKVVTEIKKPIVGLGKTLGSIESEKRNQALMSDFLDENKEVEAMQNDQTAMSAGKTIAIIIGVVLFIIIIMLVWNS